MKSCFVILSLLCQLMVNAQMRMVFKDKATGLYGYRDDQGKVVIPPVFHTALPFTEDVTFVREPVGGLAIPIKKFGSQMGNDFHIEEAQKVLLGGIFGATGGDDLTVKQPTPPLTKYNSILFDYIKPWERIREVEPSGLSVGKDESDGTPPIVTHKKSGLNYMHMYSVFEREEHSSIIANSELFRLRMPFEFMQEAGSDPYGFGLEYLFWLKAGASPCADYHHIAFLVMSDNTLRVFSDRAKYEDAKVCGGFNCWNGKKELDYQNSDNYKQVGAFEPKENGVNHLEVIRNSDEFFIYINDKLMFNVKIPECSFGYGDFPIPLFYKKGSFRFYAGSEYTVYNKRE